MPEIQNIATLTSKGQITLPKPIRQALGVEVGEKLAFSLRGGEVVVTRVDTPVFEDSAIGAFLGLLEADIRAARHIQSLPEDLVHALLTNVGRTVHLDDVIDGDVAL